MSQNWSHEGLQAAFARELIHRRKVFSGHFSSYLSSGLDMRIRADYDREGISARAARRTLDKAREFVNKAREVTQK